MKIIMTFLPFLFIGMTVSSAQDSTVVHNRVDSLKNVIKTNQKTLAQTARAIADMAQEIRTASISDHEKEIYQKYEEEYRELREELHELEKELLTTEIGLIEKKDSLCIFII